jgi:hypothetical protein
LLKAVQCGERLKTEIEGGDDENKGRLQSWMYPDKRGGSDLSLASGAAALPTLRMAVAPVRVDLKKTK